MLRTRLTDVLEIEHPVMLAGMGGVSYHRLVAAGEGVGDLGSRVEALVEHHCAGTDENDAEHDGDEAGKSVGVHL
jgi:NAD(P)H-dependent flavin oxidoreductase YrpB (nitropropane dioxygenase family)